MRAERSRSIAAIFLDGSLIDRAIRKAAREALLAHQREGLPVAVWRDGKTAWLQPEEIEIPDEQLL